MVTNKKNLKGIKINPSGTVFFWNEKINTRNVIWQYKWIDLCLKGWVNLRFFLERKSYTYNEIIFKKQIFCGYNPEKKEITICKQCQFFFFQLLYLMSFGLELWWIIEAEGKSLKHFFFDFWNETPCIFVIYNYETYRATFNSFSSIIYNKAKA